MDATEDELTPEARKERNRCLAILDVFQDQLGDLWDGLRNRMANSDYDPTAPDFMDDRLMP